MNEKKIKQKPENNKTSILFLLPLYGGVPSHSVQCLINLLNDAKEYYNINYISIVDVYLPWCRTKLFTQTLQFMELGNEPDIVAFLDQDNMYSSNDFMNLVQSFLNSDYDVLGAYYVYKDQTHRPVVYKINEDNTIECIEDLKTNQGIVKVDCIGLGFCLMRPSFLKRMHKEYGEWPFMTTVENNKFNGEDVAFFKKAKKIGAKVGVNTSIYIRHIGAAV